MLTETVRKIFYFLPEVIKVAVVKTINDLIMYLCARK
jgi:hypothetical protein